MKTQNAHYRDLPLNRGVVYKKTIGNYVVHAGGRVVSCALSSGLRNRVNAPSGEKNSERAARRRERHAKSGKHSDPVAVGDLVHFVEAQHNSGFIVEVLPRRNKLARQSPVPMPSARPFEQVIVANVDQVVPVFAAANPAPRWKLLDRYLVSAESSSLPALICITKLDLVQNASGTSGVAGADEFWEVLEEYRRIGYPVVLVSNVTGQGLDELQEALRGRVSVFLGKSGVGKTSLLNALQPGLGLRVNQVSAKTGKGKHTTARQEMFSLDFGGAVVDTPGVREFGLWDVPEDDVALFFPEMRAFVGRCRFGSDCRHDEEPGCAIRKAVSDGEISPRRYQSYLRLRVDT